jgi:3-oxoacyl-[acyl-carrier protein] reductase
VGDVLGQLADRCPDRVPLAARGSAQAAAPDTPEDEATRAGLDITFTAVLPLFAPLTGVGRAAARAYAERSGASVDDYLEQRGPVTSPEIAGTALVELVRADAANASPAYLLTDEGLQRLP